MPNFDASTGQCLVRIYREGLAAAVGHDLVLKVGAFSVEVDTHAPRISAQFQADSLRVLGTQEEYARAADPQTMTSAALSARDRAKIESSMQKKVLETARFPVIRFESTGVSAGDASDILEVRGTLNLHGVERAISVSVKGDAEASVARVRLHQPDFGIEPFRALMGALKVQADVEIEFRLGLGFDALKGAANR